MRRYAQSIGSIAAIRLRLYDFKSSVGLPVAPSIELKVKNAAHSIEMRTGGSSDREVLEQIFVEREYEPIALWGPRMILDLGANVGYSSMFFLSRYPTASVVAVEPDPVNYAICCRNLKRFGHRARVVHGAVWPESRKLVLHHGAHGDGREWTTQVGPGRGAADPNAHIKGYDVPTLINLANVDTIDLMKIDIERSELELFSRNTDTWLPHVRNLCIELHGRDCNAVFFRALSAYSYDLGRSGELTVCRNLRAGR